ncbi:MAG TPA: ATPase domain-containing protein [Candidatus Dormibacteraeota bacterium]|nr:ATPase domain-containing protein [Candidatus Dormibacteraeota bacterium]
MSPAGVTAEAASTGIPGLDAILGGGLTRHRLYLLAGAPGVGKTTLAMQFLLAGADAGESALYLAMSETAEEISEMAGSHGWSLAGVDICALTAGEEILNADHQYTVFHPSDVELAETTTRMLAEVERRNPSRVVLDSLSELRLLSGNPLRYRRQVLALKQFFAGRHCTILVLDDRLSPDPDAQLDSIAHGVFQLDRLDPEYGADRRRVRVSKFRGRDFRSGYHDYVIRRGGLVVFPRLVAAEGRYAFEQTPVSSGLPALDRLLGGGLARGTSTLLTGPPGTGKSSLAAQIACAAAARGCSASMFIFDESIRTVMTRAEGLGLGMRRYVDEGRISLFQVAPAELSPGEFTAIVCERVEREHAQVVVIDSLNGYLTAMPNERYLLIQLQELLAFLGQRGVATILIGVQGGLIGTSMITPGDASYLADTVVLLRYFEHQGAVRQAISVVKKRDGAHERTIREFALDGSGLHVGEPLSAFHGILTGVPHYVGDNQTLTGRDDE